MAMKNLSETLITVRLHPSAGALQKRYFGHWVASLFFITYPLKPWTWLLFTRKTPRLIGIGIPIINLKRPSDRFRLERGFDYLLVRVILMKTRPGVFIGRQYTFIWDSILYKCSTKYRFIHRSIRGWYQKNYSFITNKIMCPRPYTYVAAQEMWGWIDTCAHINNEYILVVCRVSQGT